MIAVKGETGEAKYECRRKGKVRRCHLDNCGF